MYSVKKRKQQITYTTRDKSLFSPPYHIKIPIVDTKPPRPFRTELSAALEVVVTNSYRTARCKINGSHEGALWHSRTKYTRNCLEAVTIFSSDHCAMPLWVKDRGGIGCMHDMYRYLPATYLLDINLRPGLNHLLWCKDTGIRLADYTPYVRGLVEDAGPVIYMDSRNRFYTEYLYSPSKDSYTKIHEKLCTGMSPFTNCIPPGRRGSKVPYQHVLTYHPFNEPLPLWMTAQLAAGFEGFNLKDKFQLPGGLADEHYHHLQYKLFDRENLPMELYVECCGNLCWAGDDPSPPYSDGE